MGGGGGGGVEGGNDTCPGLGIQLQVARRSKVC